MIYMHQKIYDSLNNDYIYENPQKNQWALMKDSAVMNQLPTKENIVLYRQSLFGNQALIWLLDTFDTPIQAPALSYFLSGYSNKNNQDKLLEINKKILDKCSILLHYDEFYDKDDTHWEELKKYFLETRGQEAVSHIISYENLVNNRALINSIKEMLALGK